MIVIFSFGIYLIFFLFALLSKHFTKNKYFVLAIGFFFSIIKSFPLIVFGISEFLMVIIGMLTAHIFEKPTKIRGVNSKLIAFVLLIVCWTIFFKIVNHALTEIIIGPIFFN